MFPHSPQISPTLFQASYPGGAKTPMSGSGESMRGCFPTRICKCYRPTDYSLQHIENFRVEIASKIDNCKRNLPSSMKKCPSPRFLDPPLKAALPRAYSTSTPISLASSLHSPASPPPSGMKNSQTRPRFGVGCMKRCRLPRQVLGQRAPECRRRRHTEHDDISMRMQ